MPNADTHHYISKNATLLKGSNPDIPLNPDTITAGLPYGATVAEQGEESLHIILIR